jgi:hypothetical protein
LHGVLAHASPCVRNTTHAATSPPPPRPLGQLKAEKEFELKAMEGLAKERENKLLTEAATKHKEVRAW